MSENTAFAHRIHYGDYSGVVFYGSPTDGSWVTRLAVSNCYIGPLFHAVLDSTWRDGGGETLPRLVSEWNTGTGWTDLGAGIVSVSPRDAEDLAQALVAVTADDLAPHASGATTAECSECAQVVRDFIFALLLRGLTVYLEDD